MNSWQQDAEGTAQWSAWDEGVRERLRTLRDTRNALADAVRLYDEKWRAIVADHAVVQRELEVAREDGARLDYADTLKEAWSRRSRRAITGSEWSIVHVHAVGESVSIREALDAARTTQEEENE